MSTQLTRLMICCDLDRTVLPNGQASQSPHAIDIFSAIIADESVFLAYVSGRDRSLIEAAIRQYNIPYPDMAIGDVGTTAYEVTTNDQGEKAFRRLSQWDAEIAPDWRGRKSMDVARMLADIDGLRLQEDEKQSTYKCSFYANVDADRSGLTQEIQNRLTAEDLNAEVIWSVDDEKNAGLVDVLPAGATKLHAVRFMMRRHNLSTDNTVYAGDSGNDEGVLISEIPAVLVKNAAADVRETVLAESRQNQTQDRLYLAKGNFWGLNGNYTAGVVEGLHHFQPWMRPRIERICQQYPQH